MTSEVLRLPYRGAPQTVALIVDTALKSADHYVVRQLAEEICRDLRSKDYLSEIVAIGHFVEARTRYMRDPRTVELVRAPYVVAEEILAGRMPQLDCDDMTALVAGLLLATGNKCRVTTVAFRNMIHRGQRQYSHVYAEAFEPRSQTWIAVDPVAGAETTSMLARGRYFKAWPVA